MKTIAFSIAFLLFMLPCMATQQMDSLAMAREQPDTLSTPDQKELAIKKPGQQTRNLPTDVPDVGQFISGYKIFWSIVFIGLGYLLIRILSLILNVLAERSTRYRITFKGAIPIIKIVGWILIISLIIIGIIQPPATTVLAFSASIGVAVGFASQDLLKNIFGGIIIIIDQPFKSGDKIEVGKYYGEVVEIGLRSTRIITPDDSLVSIPNSEIMNGSVSNSNSGEATCQVVAEFYLPLAIDTTSVRSMAIQAASVSKYVYLNKPITVLFFQEVRERKTYYKMRLKAYVRDIRDEFVFKSDMTERVISELISKGIISEP